MKTEFNEEWCLNMARLEGDAEIGAGALCSRSYLRWRVDEQRNHDEPVVAFGRFVR